MFLTRRLRVSFLSVLLKAAITFASPLASLPGFFAPAGHRAWPEEREQLVMLCQSVEKETASLHVSSTVLHVSGMNPGHPYQGLQESEVKQDFPD